MRKDHRFFAIFGAPFTLAVLAALILAGCSVDHSPLTGSVPAAMSAGVVAVARLTLPEIDPLDPTSAALLGETAADGLDTTMEDSEELVSMSTTDDKTGQSDEGLPGIQVYRENFCGTCHELAAAQTAGTFGPPHNEAGSLAETRVRDAKYTGNATTAADYIRESLLDPTAYLVPGYEVTYMKMPPFTHLKPEEIDALVTFLLDQK